MRYSEWVVWIMGEYMLPTVMLSLMVGICITILWLGFGIAFDTYKTWKKENR